MLLFNHHDTQMLKQLLFNPPISNLHSNYYVPKLTKIVLFLTSCSKKVNEKQQVIIHTTTIRTPQ